MHLLISTQPGEIKAGFAKQASFHTNSALLRGSKPHSQITQDQHTLGKWCFSTAAPSASPRGGRKERNQTHAGSISGVSARQPQEATCPPQVHLSQWGCSLACLLPWKPQAHNADTVLKCNMYGFGMARGCEFPMFSGVSAAFEPPVRLS